MNVLKPEMHKLTTVDSVSKNRNLTELKNQNLPPKKIVTNKNQFANFSSEHIDNHSISIFANKRVFIYTGNQNLSPEDVKLEAILCKLKSKVIEFFHEKVDCVISLSDSKLQRENSVHSENGKNDDEKKSILSRNNSQAEINLEQNKKLNLSFQGRRIRNSLLKLNFITNDDSKTTANVAKENQSDFLIRVRNLGIPVICAKDVWRWLSRNHLALIEEAERDQETKELEKHRNVKIIKEPGLKIFDKSVMFKPDYKQKCQLSWEYWEETCNIDSNDKTMSNDSSANLNVSSKVRKKSVQSVKPNTENNINKNIKPKSNEGYCEVCDVKYQDVGSHLESTKHLKFANTSSNFSDFDKFREGFFDIDGFMDQRIRKQKALERQESRRLIKQLSLNDFKNEVAQSEIIDGSAKIESIVEREDTNNIQIDNDATNEKESLDKGETSNCEHMLINNNDDADKNTIATSKSIVEKKVRPSLSLKRQLATQVPVHQAHVAELICADNESNEPLRLIDSVPIDNRLSISIVSRDPAVVCECVSIQYPAAFYTSLIIQSFYDTSKFISFLSPLPQPISLQSSVIPVVYSVPLITVTRSFSSCTTIAHSYPPQIFPEISFVLESDQSMISSVNVEYLASQYADIEVKNQTIIDNNPTDTETSCDNLIQYDDSLNSSIEIPSFDYHTPQNSNISSDGDKPLPPLNHFNYKYHAFSPFILRAIENDDDGSFSPLLGCSPILAKKHNHETSQDDNDFIVDLTQLINPERDNKRLFNILSTVDSNRKSKLIFSIDSLVETQFQNRFDLSLSSPRESLNQHRPEKTINSNRNFMELSPLLSSPILSSSRKQHSCSSSIRHEQQEIKLPPSPSLPRTPRRTNQSSDNDNFHRPVARPFRRAKYLARESISISTQLYLN